MAKVILAAITASIMPTRAGQLLLLGLAALLLALAGPHFLLRLNTLDITPTTERLKADKAVSAAELDNYIKSQQQAYESTGRAEFAEQLAMGLTTRNAARQGTIDLAMTITAQQASLAKAPANPYGWLRLAYLYYQREGASAVAVLAYQNSLLTAPNEGRLLVPRITLAVLLETNLLTNLREQLPAMIRVAYEFDSGGLAKAAYQYSYVSVVEQVLADNPAKLLRFQQMTGRR
jgi:hypothetical protein